MYEKLLSQLAHVCVTTPKIEASLRFYKDVLGLEESGRDKGSVFLRGWGEHFFHSLELKEGKEPSLAHTGWRAQGPDQLEAAVKRIEKTGFGLGWFDGNAGHGKAYRYRGPGGHEHHLFWDVTRFKAEGADAPLYPNRPQRFSPRGVAARSLDHVTVATANPEKDAVWYAEALGHRYMEATIADPEANFGKFVVFAMTTVCERSHDFGMVADFSGAPGRVNHIAFWVDQREELRRAADVLLDADIAIEFGPGRHGMGEQDYLYCREPGGMRIELNSGGYKNYEPDFETVRWTPSQGSNVYYKNLKMPHSMFESFPPADMSKAAENMAKTALFV
jgi:catechol 2,3-dioxygenase